MTSETTIENDASRILSACAEQMWERLQAKEPYYRCRAGRNVETLPTGSLEEAEIDASEGMRIAATISTLDRVRLSQTDQITADVLAHMAEDITRQPEEWWDSFPVTPYVSIIGISSHLRQVFAPFIFTDKSDSDRYLSLLTDYRNLLRNSAEKMLSLAERDWRIAQPAIAGAQSVLVGLRAAVLQTLIPKAETLSPLGGAASSIGETIARRVNDEILPAVDMLIAILNDDYARLAPSSVGLVHMRGGDEAYARAIRRHLTEPVAFETLHAIGLEDVARITDAMARLRAENGWAAREDVFHAELRQSPASYAASPEAVEVAYHRYLDKMNAALPTLFRKVPDAPLRIVRLPQDAEAGMAYGYYEGPSRAGDAGTYYFNGSSLSDRLQIRAAALILHEGIPGHHFHLARQVENIGLPAIRRENGEISVFNEGWAEYASGLGVEAGVYDDPIDLYGRYLHERFIAQRLVVDTGLNALGWTLDEARAFMRNNTLESEDQITAELLRYSTDWHGQSLSYHYGLRQFRDLRKHAATAPGFDVRDFHETILSEGALPMRVLNENIMRRFPVSGTGVSP
ncbi:MAG: DUF885 domain-containing protein [Sphingobium sp.]